MCFLILKTAEKDLAIEIYFKMDADFCAWLPDLEILIQEKQTEFPGLRYIMK